MKRKRATKAVRSLSAKKVGAKQASGVRGGGKKKTGGQQEFLTYNMKQAFITDVNFSDK